MSDSVKLSVGLLLASVMALVLVSASGCAHNEVGYIVRQGALAPVDRTFIVEPAAVVRPAAPDPDRLIDFYASPKAVVRDYRELDMITILAWGRTQEEQIAELKERTRAAGGDGVILLDQSLTAEPSLNYSDSTCQIDSVQLRGVVITYEGDDQSATEERAPAGH